MCPCRYLFSTTMHHNIRLWNAAATGNIGEIRRQVRLAKTYNRTREQSFPDFLSSSNTANGHTALVSASIGGHLPCMKLLIREGSSLDHTDKKGMTPLMHAAIHGRAGCVKLLLLSLGDSEKQKRLLRFRDERGLTALDLARVAQKDWVFARKRVSAIGSFIANKTYSKRRQGGKHALSSLLPPHGDQTDSHVDQAIDFQWTNPKPPPMKKEIVVEREKRKEDQLLVKELLKVGNTGMDAEKAERVLQAQQKKREEFSEKAKVEADRQKLMQQKRTEKERKELAEKAKKDKRRKERKEKKIEMERKKDQRRKQRELRQKMSKGKKGGRHRSKMRRTA